MSKVLYQVTGMNEKQALAVGQLLAHNTHFASDQHVVVRPMPTVTADTRKLLLDAIEIIEEEREVIHTSNAEADGVVRDPDAVEFIKRYDDWLSAAREAVK